MCFPLRAKEHKWENQKVRSDCKVQPLLCAPHTRVSTESKSTNRSVLSDPLLPYSPWNSPEQNTGMGSLYFLQGIFPTQGLIPGLLHCRQILYQLSHKGTPRILEWVAYPFSCGSSQPRDRTGVSCTAADFLPTELSGKPRLVNNCLVSQTLLIQTSSSYFLCTERGKRVNNGAGSSSYFFF